MTSPMLHDDGRPVAPKKGRGSGGRPAAWTPRTGRAFKAALCLALALHGVLTVVSFAQHGYAGFFPPFAQSNTTQIFSDLTWALGLVNLGVFFDMKQRGVSNAWFAVHALGTVLFGSFAPLVYFLVRESRHPV